MKKSLITSGLLALAMLSASSAFAEANCQAHQKNEQIPQADFQKALEKHGFTIKKFKTDGNCFEMYGKSKGGKKVEMYFDTKDGKIVKSEID
ncbi:PepSY domain-containing protein [Moraxellaceae bacterium 17A]|nr:PepSY domain-containing protein [Moraxellaceae bacterium 17A]